MNFRAYHLIFTFTCLFFGLLLAGCSSVHSPAGINGTPTRSVHKTAAPFPSQPAKKTLTPTNSSTAIISPSPTSQRDIKLSLITTVGKGFASEFLRSPDGTLIAILEGAQTENSRLRWLEADSGKEIGAVQLEQSWGLYDFSRDNRWLLVFNGFGVNVVDTTIGEVDTCCGGGMGWGTGYRFSLDNRYFSYLGTDYTTGGPYYFVGVYDLEAHSDIETQTDRLWATQRAQGASSWDSNQSYPVLNSS